MSLAISYFYLRPDDGTLIIGTKVTETHFCFKDTMYYVGGMYFTFFYRLM